CAHLDIAPYVECQLSSPSTSREATVPQVSPVVLMSASGRKAPRAEPSPGVIAQYLLVAYVSGMNRPIIPATLPENNGPAATQQPYSPDWLNALNDAKRQSPEIKEFSRRMHESGGEHVTWVIWHYRMKSLWTPPMALWQQGSMFFLDCGRGPFAVTAGH